MTVSPEAARSADVEVDVAIVGAGPVGLVLGIQLAQRGVAAVILEQWPSPYPLPRAVHFDHEVGRILQSCGIGDLVRAASEPATLYEWQNGAGTTLLKFGRVGAAASGWPFSSMFCQPELERLLDQRAAALAGVDVRRGIRVRSIDQGDDHVVVGCGPVELDADHQLVEATGEPTQVRAGYVVGCDGANSTVRDLLGVTVDDRGFCYDWLIVDVILDEPRVFDPVNLQVCDPARPTTAVSGGPGRRRWEFMRLPHERIEDLNRDSRAWELLAPWDVHPGNLAWKLDLVIDGQAGPELLATYEQERRPSASAAVDFSIELGKVICVPDPAEAAARDEVMAAGFDGEVSDAPGIPGLTGGVVQARAPLAGELFRQGDLDGQLFDDVWGVGFRLVTVDQDVTDLDPGLAAWFGSIGGAVVDVRASKDLAAWFDANRVRWALQRPDFYLFGAAADLGGATAMLTELRHRLTPSSVG